MHGAPMDSDSNHANGGTQGASTDVAALHAKIDALAAQMNMLVERQRWQAELVEEATPIVKLAMDDLSERLQKLEDDGWTQFGEAALGVSQRIINNYGPDDVAELGDAIVGILDTVRAVTQPAVLSIANDASAAIENAGETRPVGVVGMVKATQDEDVQRGMAVMFEVLRNVGKGVKKARLDRRMGGKAGKRQTQKRAARLAVHTKPTRPRSAQPENGAAPACAVTQPGPVAQVSPMPELGVPLTAEGYLTNPEDWSEDLAVKLAATVGVSELVEAHWTVIRFARAEYLSKSVSPNIRRLTTGSGLGTREIYSLFPKAPGKSIARVAGIPKPAGCI